MKKEKTTIVVAGVLIGVIAAMLVFFGNPANMGFCIACFLRPGIQEYGDYVTEHDNNHDGVAEIIRKFIL